MIQVDRRKFSCFLITVICCAGCSGGMKTTVYEEQPGNEVSLSVHEGIFSNEAQRIKYRTEGKTCAVIELSAPVKVSQSDREEAWGFYQFPSIAKADDGTLIVSWSMVNDSHESYGKKSDRPEGPMVSKDGGTTWQTIDKNYNAYTRMPVAQPKIAAGLLGVPFFSGLAVHRVIGCRQILVCASGRIPGSVFQLQGERRRDIFFPRYAEGSGFVEICD